MKYSTVVSWVKVIGFSLSFNIQNYEQVAAVGAAHLPGVYITMLLGFELGTSTSSSSDFCAVFPGTLRHAGAVH